MLLLLQDEEAGISVIRALEEKQKFGDTWFNVSKYFSIFVLKSIFVLQKNPSN